jgi:hypothetical protein
MKGKIIIAVAVALLEFAIGVWIGTSIASRTAENRCW